MELVSAAKDEGELMLDYYKINVHVCVCVCTCLFPPVQRWSEMHVEQYQEPQSDCCHSFHQSLCRSFHYQFARRQRCTHYTHQQLIG